MDCVTLEVDHVKLPPIILGVAIKSVLEPTQIVSLLTERVGAGIVVISQIQVVVFHVAVS